MKKNFILFILLFCLCFTIYAQPGKEISNYFVYKKIDTSVLKMEVLYPPSLEKGKEYPCIVFFYGGGWIARNFDQFKVFAKHFAKEGLVCFLADYRTRSKQGTTPFESLKNAKSAIRFIRENADKFHINNNFLVASGGSAGGQLAAASAMINGYNDLTDDLSVSCVPNALVLFNPVIDNSTGGYGYDRIGEAFKDFSALHNIHNGTAPPTIIFQGTKDHLIQEATLRYYQTVIGKVGSRCNLILYIGGDHGFFNKKGFVEKTLFEADKFLTS